MLANAFTIAFSRFQDRDDLTTQVEALVSWMEADAKFLDVLENNSFEKVPHESIAVMLRETSEIVRKLKVNEHIQIEYFQASYSSREKYIIDIIWALP